MRTVDLLDGYLLGTLTSEEKQGVEIKLANDEEFAKAFERHKQLISTMQQYEKRNQLSALLKTVHQQEIGKEAKYIALHKKETVAQKYGKTLAVAATVGVVAVLGTIMLLGMGGYLLKKQSSDITDLKRNIFEIKSSQSAIIEGIKNVKNKANKRYASAPANVEGTGFSLNNKGYFITSWHMIKEADSIFVENTQLERTSAKLIAADPSTDIAILKIENDSVIKTLQVPYTIITNETQIGEKVYTLGYPRKDVVYGEGSISALSGYNNDASMYQVSVPVNPGNSGGPLLDENGNVIGIIRGKVVTAEGTGFAIKSNYIKQLIDSLKEDNIKKDLTFSNRKNTLKSLKRSEQIKRLQPFVLNVMVYKKN